MRLTENIRQVWYDLRHQPVVTWVSVVGTALSVFLLMVVISIQQLSVLPFAPESNRPRLLYGEYFHFRSLENEVFGGSSAGLTPQRAGEIYGGLDGVEKESIFADQIFTGEAEGTNGKSINVYVKMADENFWTIYDHTLLAGRYYDEAESENAAKVAVIAEHVSRRLFDTDNAVGEILSVDFVPYRVIGVVADHSPLARQAWGDVFIPLGPSSNDYNNNMIIALLPKQGVSIDHIKKQIENRYSELATRMAAEGYCPVYHDTPYTAEIVAKSDFGSDRTPDLEGGRRQRYITYLVLLLLPAINLASMLHSRIRRRIGEFGIRRAFGCTRFGLIRNVVSENFIVTVFGGIIGWICSVMYLSLFNGVLMMPFKTEVSGTPEFAMLLNWRFVLAIFLVCFVLNIISASIPAWQASRLNIVEAINGRQKS